MVKLIKIEKPAILRLKALRWTVDILELHAQGKKPTKLLMNKYNHAKIKDALKCETNEKCAYCESKITHVYYGDIEHILPKSKYINLTFEWSNLTLACSICNGLKSDYYDVNYSVINPYADDITSHLTFIGAFLIHIPGSKRGEITHTLLELNRTPLYERRLEKLNVFRKYLDNYTNENVPFLKQVYKKEILNMINPDKEYSSLIRDNLNIFISKGLAF